MFKIFALAVCEYALFLLSANIYQATLFGQEGAVLSFNGLLVTRDNVCGSLARDPSLRSGRQEGERQVFFGTN
ncbi:MAG TPA: hypothetical protein VK102_04390 [Sphingobacterium sp.]|nr:hypothetical protein [Sphingobacterium sp.]